METAADVIVPVPGAGAEIVGIFVVGRRFDDRIVRTVDVPFLEVLAAAVGQAIVRLRLLHGQGARLSEAPPALECPVCRCVRGVDLSPDVLAGRPADESDDVWSLCVVLYEMVSGEHPFTGAGADEVADRIRRQLVGRGARSATDSETQAPVAAFAASMLRAAQSARPATARAFAAALREMVGTK